MPGAQVCSQGLQFLGAHIVGFLAAQGRQVVLGGQLGCCIALRLQRIGLGTCAGLLPLGLHHFFEAALLVRLAHIRRPALGGVFWQFLGVGLVLAPHPIGGFGRSGIHSPSPSIFTAVLSISRCGLDGVHSGCPYVR
ncbi:hypothetical protein AX13_08305 [Comamonas aquatica DA1877]|uniref:Uncharacterized protein n=1 Tax=Comamonas aquatica DA1877 TaxID=1457173 RepID=A0A014Q7B7_9BURK|nr:hypothetical protein AX13_08305 [Comamonas aquatica DA1877]